MIIFQHSFLFYFFAIRSQGVWKRDKEVLWFSFSLCTSMLIFNFHESFLLLIAMKFHFCLRKHFVFQRKWIGQFLLALMHRYLILRAKKFFAYFFLKPNFLPPSL